MIQNLMLSRSVLTFVVSCLRSAKKQMHGVTWRGRSIVQLDMYVAVSAPNASEVSTCTNRSLRISSRRVDRVEAAALYQCRSWSSEVFASREERPSNKTRQPEGVSQGGGGEKEQSPQVVGCVAPSTKGSFAGTCPIKLSVTQQAIQRSNLCCITRADNECTRDALLCMHSMPALVRLLVCVNALWMRQARRSCSAGRGGHAQVQRACSAAWGY